MSRHPGDWKKIADAIMKSNPRWDEPADKAMERKYPTGHPTSQRSAIVDGHINGAMIKTYRRKMKKAGNLVAIQQLNKWLGHRDPILEQISVGETQKERDVQHDETQTKRRAAATEREQEEDKVRLQKMKDILTK
jgi:hypothetical protein